MFVAARLHKQIGEKGIGQIRGVGSQHRCQYAAISQLLAETCHNITATGHTLVVMRQPLQQQIFLI